MVGFQIALSVFVVIALAFFVKNWLISIPIAIGFAMASIDTVSLPMIKTIHDMPLSYHWWLIVPFMLYAVQPFIFYKALDYTSMTKMNVLWDVSSDIMVTAIGLWWFHEHITYRQMIGIMLGVVSISLIGSSS